jgi:hypothetical protein
MSIYVLAFTVVSLMATVFLYTRVYKK